MKNLFYYLFCAIITLFEFSGCYANTSSKGSREVKKDSIVTSKGNEYPDYLFDTWGIEHSADTNIKLFRNRTFEYHSCNDNGDPIVQKGTFSFDGKYVILKFDNGKTTKLHCYYDKKRRAYILKYKYYDFRKGLSNDIGDDDEDYIEDVNTDTLP